MSLERVKSGVDRYLDKCFSAATEDERCAYVDRIITYLNRVERRGIISEDERVKLNHYAMGRCGCSKDPPTAEPTSEIPRVLNG